MGDRPARRGAYPQLGEVLGGIEWTGIDPKRPTEFPPPASLHVGPASNGA